MLYIVAIDQRHGSASRGFGPVCPRLDTVVLVGGSGPVYHVRATARLHGRLGMRGTYTERRRGGGVRGEWRREGAGARADEEGEGQVSGGALGRCSEQGRSGMRVGPAGRGQEGEGTFFQGIGREAGQARGSRVDTAPITGGGES